MTGAKICTVVCDSQRLFRHIKYRMQPFMRLQALQDIWRVCHCRQAAIQVDSLCSVRAGCNCSMLHVHHSKGRSDEVDLGVVHELLQQLLVPEPCSALLLVQALRWIQTLSDSHEQQT